jgi:hypothetical protein
MQNSRFCGYNKNSGTIWQILPHSGQCRISIFYRTLDTGVRIQRIPIKSFVLFSQNRVDYEKRVKAQAQRHAAT